MAATFSRSSTPISIESLSDMDKAMDIENEEICADEKPKEEYVPPSRTVNMESYLNTVSF